MESYDPLFSEEWLLSNVLSTADFYAADQLQNDYDGRLWKTEELPATTLQNDQLTDSEINEATDGFNISWLEDEGASISNLDASLHSPEPIKPVGEVDILDEFQPTNVEVPSTSETTEVYCDAEVNEELAAMIILEALSDPNTMDQANDLSAAEVESILSSPPASPNILSPPVSPNQSLSNPSSPDWCQDSSSDYSPEEARSKRKRPAPYSRAGVPQAKAGREQSQKDRKKQQNKTAATKYRQKKRAEQDAKKSDMSELEETNASLKRQVESISSEIKYMKSLLNDVLRSKGVVII